jgi:hypothetical protein
MLTKKYFNLMRKILLLPFCFILFQVNAQSFPDLDKSVLDLAYYPNNSAHDLTFTKTNDEKAAVLTKIKISYSRPMAKGRKVFGGLVKYKEPWRLGANETTEVTFYSSVKIGENILFPGTYAMYCIPENDKWILKIHPTINGWGVYNFDFSKELASVSSPIKNSSETIEALSMVMYKAESGTVLLKIGWDKSYAEFPITLL